MSHSSFKVIDETNAGIFETKQTTLTSLTGENVNIEVGGNTHLKGSLIAAGSINEKGEFEDNKKLSLKTDTLTFANSTNSEYSSSNSYNIGTNIGYGTKTNTQANVEETTAKVNSSTYSSLNQKSYSNSKTLATLGKGDIQIENTDNSDDITRLNQDTNKLNKNLYAGSISSSVDATLDHRLLTKDGRKQIAQDYEAMNKNMNIIAGTLPDATSDNAIEGERLKFRVSYNP